MILCTCHLQYKCQEVIYHKTPSIHHVSRLKKNNNPSDLDDAVPAFSTSATKDVLTKFAFGFLTGNWEKLETQMDRC